MSNTVHDKIILSRAQVQIIICTVADAYPHYGNKVEKALINEGYEFDNSDEFVQVLRKLPTSKLETLLLFLAD